jgi:hypothetical protein
MVARRIESPSAYARFGNCSLPTLKLSISRDLMRALPIARRPIASAPMAAAPSASIPIEYAPEATAPTALAPVASATTLRLERRLSRTLLS